MYFAGPIKCPNCDSPISSDAYVCPYCSTTAPARGPWRRRSPYPLIVFAAVALAIMGIASVFGTKLWQQVIQFFTEK